MHKRIPPTGNPRGRSSLLIGCDNRSFSLQGRAPLPMPSAMGGTVFHEPAQGVTWSYSDLCPRPSAVALASPLKCLYYSTLCPGCQALFWTFFYFFWRVLPSPFQRLTGCEFNRLVHTYIPHNRTPCGRGLCHQGLTDSRGSCIPHLFGLSGFALLPSFTS